MRRSVALAGLVLVAVGLTLPALAQDDRPRVLVTTVDGTITPVIADHVASAIGRAEDGGFEALVVRVDTPGGLDTSMRDIVQDFLAADVPVVVYVSPDGARAASAGAIITFASHIAAMAPGTALGASTPVDLEGGDVERKIIEDAAAFAESIARLRGRDVEFAVATVREGRSAPAERAVEIGAVDLLAPSLPALLDEIDGVEVDLPGDRTVTLRTADAEVEEHDLGLLRRIQQVLADPNLAFLFMSIGTLALIYELASPGVGGAAIVGCIFIILALFGLAVLPVNMAGLLFLVLAMVLFVAEVFAPGIGVAAAGGAIALGLSGVFLFRDTPGMEVSAAVFGPVAVVVAVAVVFAGRLAVRAQRGESTTTGSGVLRGRTATVTNATGDRGQALVDGAWWSVRSRSGTPLADGTHVRVCDVEGISLVVEEVQIPDEAQIPDEEGEGT